MVERVSAHTECHRRHERRQVDSHVCRYQSQCCKITCMSYSYIQSLLKLEIIPLLNESHFPVPTMRSMCCAALCVLGKQIREDKCLIIQEGKSKLISCLWINFPLESICFGKDLKRRQHRPQELDFPFLFFTINQFCFFEVKETQTKAGAIWIVNVLTYNRGIDCPCQYLRYRKDLVLFRSVFQRLSACREHDT